MLAHRLFLEDVVDQDFSLIAIHASVEDYKIAFLLNKYLGLRLARNRKDIDIEYKSVRAFFPFFDFEDQLKYISYHFMRNRSLENSVKLISKGLLFDEEVSGSSVFLLPEFSRTDFFLKITSDSENFQEKPLVEKINKIPQVSTAYAVNTEKIKSKENLIFD